MSSPTQDVGVPPPLMTEISQFSLQDDHDGPRTTRSTADLINLRLGDGQSPEEAAVRILRSLPPPIPRMHSDLHPLDYERMAQLLNLAQAERSSHSNSPKDSRDHSYTSGQGMSPGSSRASSAVHMAGIGDRTSTSKLHQQLAALRARKPPRQSPPNNCDALSHGLSFSAAERRRVQSYTSGTEEPGSSMARDQILGLQSSQTNLKVSMRRAVFAKRTWHVDEDESDEEGKERTTSNRREVTAQSAVCLGPRLSNSRSVRLMMQMGMLRESKPLKRLGGFGNKIVPERSTFPASALQGLGSQGVIVPGGSRRPEGSPGGSPGGSQGVIVPGDLAPQHCPTPPPRSS